MDGLRAAPAVALCVIALAGCGSPRRPAPQPKPDRPPAIAITGDILLAGRIQQLIETQGPAAPLAGVSQVLRDADLAIGNLECSLSHRGQPADKQYTFRASPEAAAALAEAGIDLVTLANNHSVDYGPAALGDTIAALKERGIAAVGAGRDATEARRPAIFQLGEPPLTIAVVAFSNMQPVSFYAGRDRPGTNPASAEEIGSDISKAKREADIVIALFHWGDERSDSPTDRQRRLAYAAADSGADLVVGHHPHVLQGFERRGRSLIAYSLGNFLFPSRGECRRTAVLRYSPYRDGRALVEVIPCVIDGFRPRLASPAERQECLRYLAARSRALGVDMPPGRSSVSLPGRNAAGPGGKGER